MKQRRVPFGTANLLSVFEGLEGGFAVFTGIIAGLSFTTADRRILIATGIISILVSGFNSSAVRYATEHYLDELDGHEKRRVLAVYLLPAAVEFMVYVLVCLITLLPLLLIESLPLALSFTIALTEAALFGAGYYRGCLLRTKPLRDGTELALIGASIIAVGALAGLGITQFIAV